MTKEIDSNINRYNVLDTEAAKARNTKSLESDIKFYMSGLTALYTDFTKVKTLLNDYYSDLIIRLKQLSDELESGMYKSRVGIIDDKAILSNLFSLSEHENVTENFRKHLVNIGRATDADNFISANNKISNRNIANVKEAIEAFSDARAILLTGLDLKPLNTNNPNTETYTTNNYIGDTDYGFITELDPNGEYITSDYSSKQISKVRIVQTIPLSEVKKQVKEMIILIDEYKKGIIEANRCVSNIGLGFTMRMGKDNVVVKAQDGKITSKEVVKELRFATKDNKKLVKLVKGYSSISLYCIMPWVDMIKSFELYIQYINKNISKA